MIKNIFGEVEKSDYQKFKEKFEPKLTTDDCYTPQEIYEWILRYVREQCNVDDSAIILRPFKPGGDYKKEYYSSNYVVIDNPPFSILSEIIRFYNSANVKYFLFAPHLTLFSSTAECTRIVASADITYHNGAKVKTSFVSNMFGDIAIIADPTYRKNIHRIQDRTKIKLPKYNYPHNVVTVSRLAAIVERGGSFSIHKNEAKRISALDCQKSVKKTIFGSGYLIGNKKAAELKAAELKAAEDIFTWKLSDKEKAIINYLDTGKNDINSLF